MTLWAHVYRSWVSGALRLRGLDPAALRDGSADGWFDIIEVMFVEWCRPGDRAVSEVHRLVFTDEFDEPPFFDPEAALVSARQVAAFAALDAAGPAR